MLVPSLCWRNALTLAGRTATPWFARQVTFGRAFCDARRPRPSSPASTPRITPSGIRKYATGLSTSPKTSSGDTFPRIDIPQYKPDKQGNIYPPALNIYHAGVYRTSLLGIFRVCSIGFAFYGSFMAAPVFLYNPDYSSLWANVTVIASTIPFWLFSTPYVTAIDVVLPPHARRSKDALERYVTQPPPDMQLEMTVFRRVWPKPKRIDVYFDELMRLPSRLGRLTNLEHTPYLNKQKKANDGFYGSIARRFMGRYVVHEQVKEKAVARGLFPRIWKALPVEGEAQKHDKAGWTDRPPANPTEVAMPRAPAPRKLNVRRTSSGLGSRPKTP